MCSQETTPHEQATKSGHTVVVEVLSDDENSSEGMATTTVVHGDENTDELESKTWCIEAPNGKRMKFTSSALKAWSQTSQFAYKFKVWKEGESEDSAVWLCEAFPKK